MSGRVMILGDTHGDLPDIERVCQTCVRVDIDHILQVGDFGGLWNGQGKIKKLHRVLNKYAMTMDWLDGNHEDFYLMAARGCNTDEAEPVELSTRVRYLPRGYVWEWEGLVCASLGGASSVDRPGRIPGKTWFKEELITRADVDRLIANVGDRQLDVLFSHDAPDTGPLNNYLSTTAHQWGVRELIASDAQRELMNIAVDTLQPRMNIHGHYHWPYVSRRGLTIVRGLDLARFNASMYALDVEGFREEVRDWMGE